MFNRSTRVIPLLSSDDANDELEETYLEKQINKKPATTAVTPATIEYSNSQEIEFDEVQRPGDSINNAISSDDKLDRLDTGSVLASTATTPVVRPTGAIKKTFSSEFRPSPAARFGRLDESPQENAMFTTKQQLFAHETDMPTAHTAAVRRPSMNGGMVRRDSFLNPINTALPQAIRFIDFQVLKSIGKFPLYEQDKTICVGVKQIDTTESLIVYVSYNHKFLDSRMYQCCIDGISSILSTQKNFKSCYIWIDKCCIVQNENINELTDIMQILSLCDCILTPISTESSFDKNIIDNYTSDYTCVEWNDVDCGYINQNINRLTVLCSTFTPVNASKANKFSQVMSLFHDQNLRPHFIYGATQHRINRIPVLLPPLNYSYFNELDPKKGKVCPHYERELVDGLVDRLLPIIKYKTIGWNGEVNTNGLPHGSGVLVGENWSKYEGEMRDGNLYGKGKMKFPNGNMYDGDWVDGKKEGEGVYRNIAGIEYRGNYLNNKRHGKGRYVYGSGVVYEGDWVEDRCHGVGKQIYTDGSVYEGQFDRDNISGQGKFVYANGSTYILTDRFMKVEILPAFLAKQVV
jgi:hypothetical protein